jgi:transposase
MERSTIHLLAKRGKSQRQIARELGRSRVTVARALREPVDRSPPKRRRASKTDPYRPQVEEGVRAGLTGVRMLELARGDRDRPYTGGHAVFRTLVRRVRREHAQQTADVPVRFEGLPGEYLQVDWGEVRRFPFTGRPPGTRYFLCCRLKYSRWSWLRWTTDMRQETLLRGLVDCFRALGWVPWVLVFDNMKTVTTGRDAQDQPVWHPALLQLAREFDFHPEACTPGAGNQKGSVESLVKWVAGNFLPGRAFADDADLAAQAADWTDGANARPSAATGEPPVARLPAEAAGGGALPATADDYGFLATARVTAGALVPVAGNLYSVPVAHAGAPVAVRLHPDRVVIWRDAACLAAHRRAPDGAHRRVVDPEHFAPLFAKKPRARVMLYRAALLELGEPVAAYVAAVSRRRRDRLRAEVLATHALLAAHGAAALAAAAERATAAGAYGAEYLAALLAAPAGAVAPRPAALVLAGLPTQAEVDRGLGFYEAFVRRDDAVRAPPATSAGGAS